jgi:(+)-neomenthol dehydrogenase
VTGANKGIGLAICKQLASNGIIVVLTARDKNRGIQALEKLKTEFSELTDFLIFHQLDVADQSSVDSFADFLKTHFGKLDILVNNAAIGGATLDDDTIKAISDKTTRDQIKWHQMMNESYEDALKCLETNYYGAKRMIEANLPLLQFSDSPRIVNVSSSMGQLKNIPNEWVKSKLSDVDNLNEEIVDEVIKKYLKDFKEGGLLENGWPMFLSAYTVSKASMVAYTRIIAKKYPQFCVNCVCPGYVKTDINFNTGILTVDEGAEGPVKLALLPNGGPSGLFFINNQVVPF